MIVKVNFVGTVLDGTKKSTLPDTLKIHIHPGGKKKAKELFLNWVKITNGIKGDSGVFHPLNGYGTIEVKNVEEVDG